MYHGRKWAALCFVVVVSTIGYAEAICSSEQAKADPEYPYKYFSSKTLYDSVRGSPPSFADRAPEGCTPKHIVILARHGSRYPGSDKIDFLRDDLPALARKINMTGTATLCPQDIAKIQNWTNWYDPALDKDLAPTGEREMRALAVRFVSLFPELLSGAEAHPEKFRFLSTDRRRTIQSAHVFARELFRDNSSITPDVQVNDKLLHFYDYCDKYIVEVDTNKTVEDDVKAWANGPEMDQVVVNFGVALGIPRIQLNEDFVSDVLQKGCTEEEWSTGEDSAWCLPFTTNDFKAYEYGEDMEDYLYKSYAFPINYEQACYLRYDILEALKNASLETLNPMLGHFAWTHSSAMTMMMTSMGFIPDEGVLRSDDYANQADRRFRTSLLNPGSSNLAFVLYDCGADGMKLQVLLNENVLALPVDSPNVDNLWDLEDALNYYNFYEGQCDFEKVCRVEGVEGETTTTATPAATFSDAAIRTTHPDMTTTSAGAVLRPMFMLMAIVFSRFAFLLH